MNTLSPLHLVFTSPFQHQGLKQALAASQSGHCILLLENGVYGALKSCALLNPLATEHLKLFALEASLIATGIQHLPTGLHPHIQRISWEAFVTLTTQTQPIISWY